MQDHFGRVLSDRLSSLPTHPFLPFYLFVNPAADASEKEEEEKGVGWEKPRLLEMQQMRLSLSLV